MTDDCLNADLTSIARLYEDSLSKHGTAAMGVGWRDSSSHALRFSKLAAVIDDRDSAASVNDLGCGYGAFYEFLTNSGFVVSLFRGYDISEEMLVRARKLQPKGEFLLGSTLDRVADYSFACGIFNVRLEADETAWLRHIERTLQNLHDFSARGFAFNLLTTYVDYRERHLFYGDPSYFFDLCKRRYSRKVALLHDYPLYEWTIVVRK
jgi:SAM-dependent methyltransferase